MSFLPNGAAKDNTLLLWLLARLLQNLQLDVCYAAQLSEAERNLIGFIMNVPPPHRAAELRNRLTGMIGIDVDAWLSEIATINAATDGPPEPGKSILSVKISDVIPEQVSWLWGMRFARRSLGLIVGKPGCGKSFLTDAIVAGATNGWVWPDGRPGVVQPVALPLGVAGPAPTAGCNAIMLNAEDDASYTIRPRLEACREPQRSTAA